MRSTIICVDDDKFLLSTLASQLEDLIGKNYAVEKAISGYEALEILEDHVNSDTPVSVVISDYIMPGMRGDELLCKIHERDKNIRKIMLTGYTQIEGIINAINNAALYRFVSKPWDKRDMMLTVIQAVKSFEQENVNRNLLQGFEKLYRGYEGQLSHIINTVSNAIDLRTRDKAGTSMMVAELAAKLGAKAGLNADGLKALRTMAALRNIGRLILSDADLASIRGNEQAVYENHTLIAMQNKAAQMLFISNPALDRNLLKGITTHLEKFDGSGLQKLKGEAIPIEGRIIGITALYNAFLTAGTPRADALMRVAAWKNIVFDPKLIEQLISVEQ